MNATIEDRIRACAELQKPAPRPIAQTVLIAAFCGLLGVTAAHVALTELGRAAAVGIELRIEAGQ